MAIAVLFYAAAIANTRAADRLFDQWEFFRAAKLYQKEAAKHPGADVYFKLGECYRKMNLYREQQAAYDKVNAYGQYGKPEFYLNYGQVLRSNGWNERAKAAFDKYSELAPSDMRGRFFGESIGIVTADHKWDEPVSVTNVAGLNTANADLCPVPYKDGVVFTSNRKAPGSDKIYGWTGANYLDLYYAKSVSGVGYTDVTPFGGHKIIKKFNDGPACFSQHFDTIYISRVDKDLKGIKKKTLGIERNKIFVSAMKDGKWTKATPFHLNNDEYSVANPFLTADGLRLYFVSDMPGGYGETDIYYCNREGNTWGPPINMGAGINTFNREKYPTMDAKRNFYFSSDGYQGFGGLDICVALNAGGRLAKAIPLKYPFNSAADDFGIMFLKDGREGYITSNRYAGGIGDDDIFYFDLQGEKVSPDLVIAVYTIGYRPLLHEIPIQPVKAPTPVVIKAVSPRDILIHFDLDRSEIRPDAVVLLDSVVYYMNKFPTLTLLITGHCDCRGTPGYNIDLAQRRAVATLLSLRNRGVEVSRMTSAGYAIDIVPGQCLEGVYYSDPEHQSNRRVFLHFEEKSSEAALQY